MAEGGKKGVNAINTGKKEAIRWNGLQASLRTGNVFVNARSIKGDDPVVYVDDIRGIA